MSHGEAIAMATHARVLHNIPASGSIGTGFEAKEASPISCQKKQSVGTIQEFKLMNKYCICILVQLAMKLLCKAVRL